MSKVSSCKQIQIGLLYKQDLHPAEILKLLKGEGLLVSFVNVTEIIKRLQLASLVANLPHSGRPTKLSVEANAFVDQQMQSNDEVTSTPIQKKLVKGGIAVSSSNCCSIENHFFYHHFNCFKKSREHSSRCCGLAMSHGLVLHIGLTSLHLSPLNKFVQEKLLL